MPERAVEVVWDLDAKRPYIEGRPGKTQRLSDCDPYAWTSTPFSMPLLP
jgi:hypothetical protein